MQPTWIILLLTIPAFCVGQSPASPAPKVSYTLAVTQVGNNTKLTQLKAGAMFDLVCYAQDLRPNGTWTDWTGTVKPLVRGTYAVYLDVYYDSKLARSIYYTGTNTVGPEFRDHFTFANGYINGRQANLVPNRMNDVGAFSERPGINTAPVEIWRLRMKTVKPGSLSFTPNLDDLAHPRCDTLVYGNIAADPPEQSFVLPSEIVLVPCAVTVQP